MPAERRQQVLLTRSGDVSVDKREDTGKRKQKNAHGQQDEAARRSSFLEHYECLGVIGEGTYGIVLKARHKSSGTLVAVKKFKDSDDDEQVQKTAMREVRILRQLHHDNVVSLLEVFRHHGKLYLVFEYVDRTILEDLEKHPSGLEPLEVKKIMWQLIRSIAYCHQENVIHRDIKPENLLISKHGALKLCDFGFARNLVSSVKSVARYTDYVATRWYRAPELLVGTQQYSTPVDVWAIGCMFVELATGQPLFAGDSDLDQLHFIVQCLGPLPEMHRQAFIDNQLYLDAEPPHGKATETLASKAPGFGSLEQDLLRQCLRYDPTERPTCVQLLHHAYFEGFADYMLPRLERILALDADEYGVRRRSSSRPSRGSRVDRRGGHSLGSNANNTARAPSRSTSSLDAASMTASSSASTTPATVTVPTVRSKHATAAATAAALPSKKHGEPQGKPPRRAGSRQRSRRKGKPNSKHNAGQQRQQQQRQSQRQQQQMQQHRSGSLPRYTPTLDADPMPRRASPVPHQAGMKRSSSRLSQHSSTSTSTGRHSVAGGEGGNDSLPTISAAQRHASRHAQGGYSVTARTPSPSRRRLELRKTQRRARQHDAADREVGNVLHVVQPDGADIAPGLASLPHLRRGRASGAEIGGNSGNAATVMRGLTSSPSRDDESMPCTTPLATSASLPNIKPPPRASSYAAPSGSSSSMAGRAGIMRRHASMDAIYGSPATGTVTSSSSINGSGSGSGGGGVTDAQGNFDATTYKSMPKPKSRSIAAARLGRRATYDSYRSQHATMLRRSSNSPGAAMLMSQQTQQTQQQQHQQPQPQQLMQEGEATSGMPAGRTRCSGGVINSTNIFSGSNNGDSNTVGMSIGKRRRSYAGIAAAAAAAAASTTTAASSAASSVDGKDAGLLGRGRVPLVSRVATLQPLMMTAFVPPPPP